jgi:8-oxo-dGTP diphosphatase
MKPTPATLRARVAAKAAIFRGEQILLLHRSLDAADPGIWDLPGGVVAPGESLARAARREVREETGVAVRIGPMYHAEVFGSFSRGGKIRPTVGVFFHCRAPKVERLRLDRNEHSEYAWVALDDLRDYPTVPYLSRAVRAAFTSRRKERRGRRSTGPLAPARDPPSHVSYPVAA